MNHVHFLKRLLFLEGGF